MAKINKSDAVKEAANENQIEKVIADGKAMLKESGDKTIYATEDGNYWNEENKTLAVDHAFKTKTKLITIKAD